MIKANVKPKTEIKNGIHFMKWDAIKDYLRSINVGGIFGKNIDQYDPVFEIQHFAEINRDVNSSVIELKNSGIPIGELWIKNGFECEDQHDLIKSRVKEHHIRRNIHLGDFMSRAFGFGAGELNGEGHAFNIGICIEGFWIWNYGNPTNDFAGWEADDRIDFK